MSHCNYCGKRGASFEMCTTQEQAKLCEGAEMTAPAKPTIDECIEHQSWNCMDASESGDKGKQALEEAILSTLRAHKAIMEATRPEPPRVRKWPIPHPDGRQVADVICKRDYDALLAFADRMAAERDEAIQDARDSALEALGHLTDKEKAERQLAELQAEELRAWLVALDKEGE